MKASSRVIIVTTGILIATFFMIISLQAFRQNAQEFRKHSIIALDADAKESINKRLPQVILIGVKKCGTGTLQSMLSMHPQIVFAIGEPHFFDRENSPTFTNQGGNYHRGLEWYRRKMPNSNPHQITMEKSPRYFVDPVVPERIYAMNESILLIVVVRNPVARVLSDYQHAKRKEAKYINTGSIENEVLSEDQQLNKISFIVRPSLYSVHFSRWLQTFRREQILVINGDVLSTDPLAVVKEIESFLQLKPWFKPDNFWFSSVKGQFCMRQEDKEWCMSKNKGQPKPYVKPRLLKRLTELFEPYNQEFYKMVGKDFHWTSPDPKLYRGNLPLVNKQIKI